VQSGPLDERDRSAVGWIVEGHAVQEKDKPTGRLIFKPLTRERWKDLEELFGARGACGGCWCMWWKLPRAQYNRQKGEGNRKALRAIVTRGEPPGILAYRGGTPVGWCALGPRDSYPALERSRVLARVDGEPVWSVVCFFIARGCRGQGLTRELIAAAARLARKKGARILEGYPVEASGARTPDAFAFTGLSTAFLAAGFTEAARRSPRRAVYRLLLSRGR
jgi:GNAT superfamily N-acetyltransferase